MEEENGPPGRLEAGRRGEAYSPKRNSGRCYGKNRIKNVLESLKIGLVKGSASFCRVPGGGVHAGPRAGRTDVKNAYKTGTNRKQIGRRKRGKIREKSEKQRPHRNRKKIALIDF